MESRPQENLGKQVKESFYNELAGRLALYPNLQISTIKTTVLEQLQLCIKEILYLSKNYPGAVIIFGGQPINNQNCPEEYKEFLAAILQIVQLPEDRRTPAITQLATKIAELDSFEDMIEQVKIFALSLQGKLNYEEKISVEHIRKTFYEQMKKQGDIAITKQWLSSEDFEMQEPHIYWALPGLALIEALYRSKNCEGIILLDYKVVVPGNCPSEGNFPLLFKPMFENKQHIIEMSEQELEILKQLCIQNPELEPSLNNLNEERQKLISKLAASINAVAIQISQAPVFRKNIDEIVKACRDNHPVRSLSFK